MFFHNVIKRRLLSLLHPWLREEPDLDLHLGLINSLAIAKNLRLSTSALNQLMKDSSQFSFKEFTIEQFVVRFSNWSAPAFTFEAHGVSVTLLADERDAEGSRKLQKSVEEAESKRMRKEDISMKDPEGSSLHDVLERILANSLPRNRVKSSFLNLIFQHCSLQMFNINVELQSPLLNDYAYLLQVKALNAESQYFDHGSLCTGLVSVPFRPLKEISFAINGSGFDSAYKRSNQINRFCCLNDLIMYITLHDLEVAEFNIQVPELKFIFSPVDFPVLFVLGTFLSNKTVRVRNGRRLWRIAASRIGKLIQPPRLSFYKLVSKVCLWLRYVNAYGSLLVLLGYPANRLLKRSTVKMSKDQVFLNSVKQRWDLISDIEKELPADLVARARRIARYKAASSVQQAEDSCGQLLLDGRFKSFCNVLSLLVFIWKVLLRVILSTAYFLRKISPQDSHLDENLGIISEYSSPSFHFTLTLRKMFIYVYPPIQPVNEQVESHIGPCCSEVLSFRLSVKMLLFIYTEDIMEQSLCISCGKLKVKSSLVGGENMEADESKTILHAEPAKLFPFLQTSKASAVGNDEAACDSHLQNFLGEMCLNWTRARKKFEECEIELPENPFLLCEMKSFLIYPDTKKPDSGLWSFNLTVGKLNIALDYFSVSSMVVHFRHMQHALSWILENARARALSHSLQVIDDPQEIRWDMICESYARRIKMAFLRVLPEKDIQLGVFIAGPHIQVLLRKIGISDGNKDTKIHMVSQEDFRLRFNFQNVEVVAWPALRSDWGILDGCSGSGETECLRLLEPQKIDTPKPDNEKYSSCGWISLYFYLRMSGLNAYFEYVAENQHNQIFVLKPITFRLSSLRKFAHSFSSTFITFSEVFCGMAMGLTAVLFMDELSALSEVLAGLLSAISYAFHGFGSAGDVPFPMSKRPDMVWGKPENEESTAEVVPLFCEGTLFLINGIFKLRSVDFILHNSRINNKGGSVTTDAARGKDSALQRVSDCGIWISVQLICFETSYDERKLELLIELSEVQFVIIRYQECVEKSFDLSVLKNLLLRSHICLYEVSLSHCKFTLWLSPVLYVSSSSSENGTLHRCNLDGNTSCTVENSPFMVEAQSSFQSHGFGQKLGFTSNIQAPMPGHWMLINIEVADFFVTKCSVKNALISTEKFNRLRSSLSFGARFQEICWRIQGGFLCLETTALSMLVQCFASYHHRLASSLSILLPTSKGEGKAEYHNDHVTGEHAQHTPVTSQPMKWGVLEAFSIDVSQFSLDLVIEDESGGIQEFILEVDLVVNHESANMGKKFFFELSRLSIFSHVLQASTEDEIQILHFSSTTSSEFLSGLASGESSAAFQHRNGSSPIDESHTRGPDSPDEVTANFQISYQDHILKHLVASVSAEKPFSSPLQPNDVWVGSGSVSGFDMAISLSELQMFLSMVSAFSATFGKDPTSEPGQRQGAINQDVHNSFESIVPNGAIVAIQDVHQHLYFTVEGGENKYTLAGALHYSLVGERALFRVKYHVQRKWNSSILWFSLISLHAKNNSGEPLRINCHPGSGFVAISSTTDNAQALWRTLSCEPESYKGDIDWEPYNQLLKNTFYLVNKKNDSGVAFIDDIPEFIRKPGNPFKLKVLSNLSLFHDVTANHRSSNLSGTDMPIRADEDRGITYGQSRNLSSICITIEYVALTIVHELSDAKDRFPLFQACVTDFQLNLQILSSKTRVISTSKALLNYFDAQTSLWRELLYPVEMCIFYRSSCQKQSPEAILHGVPVNMYCRTKELKISLTELSLDMLLFTIGKLNLAGPFSVKSSMIFADCCKVENQTGMNLNCKFYGEQNVTLGGKQSVSIFLRHSALGKQQQEIMSVVSIQLSIPDSFATSPVQFSIREACTFAWRTRIVSLQDSRTYPGPFIVVDISRKSEDGLSIVVSPFVRIHNETRFPIELQFRRPQEKENEFASVTLKTGDTIDDSVASFDAINLFGGLKKALISLTVGNFLFSFRPEIPSLMNSSGPLFVEWSDKLQGGKAVRLSGIFDKLGYEVRKALHVGSLKCSFSTSHCTLRSSDAHVFDMHFLIQSIGREVPITQPDENRNAPIALQEQREIFLLPTVRVSNLLNLEIHVLLSETNLCSPTGCNNIGKEATIPCGSTVDFYANPAVIYFSVTLTAFSSSCKPVNSSELVRKLLKHKHDVHCLDIDLDFGGGKYVASLRLSRGYRGILEATIYTSYALKNDSDFSLFFFAANQKLPSRNEIGKLGTHIPPELGLFLPPKSTGSWFLKSYKVLLKVVEGHASEALFDLAALSGSTEISLEIDEGSGVKYIIKFGVSVGPSSSNIDVPSQIITMVPRHVILNESEENITVRQCNLEDDRASIIYINSKQRGTLKLQKEISKRSEYGPFENFIRRHRNDCDDSRIFIQFQLNESQFGWSGPLCINSLGRFFLKFRKLSNPVVSRTSKETELAAVDVVEDGSTIVVQFHKTPDGSLPYRIENYLHGLSLSYSQKDSSVDEVLGSGCSVDYVWDDLTLPHKLLVIINGMNLLREINLDKVRTWKPFYKLMQHKGLASHLHLDKNTKDQKRHFGELKVGYEVYAEGSTRVLRICELSESHKREKAVHSSSKLQLRVSQFAVHILEQSKQDLNQSMGSLYMPVVVARLQNITFDTVFTGQKKYNRIDIQSLNVDVKWAGSPFAAMLRRHQLDSSNANDCDLKIFVVLLSPVSDVKQVKYSTVILQPLDLNVDEDTLMKIVTFWRASLNSNTRSTQFYFDHFEIHPIKIIANFLPGESYSSYNSAQETLRSLLHSVVKVPSIKNMVVELNGVLVTHALITIRELFIRCAQHYSWYAMRAIYIAKGSALLPPTFASIFDDLASSSLDVFFDPSRGLMSIPGLTIGTLKFISKCIDGNGFSGTKRYFGDLGKTLRTAGSNVIFAVVTEISDSVLRGAEARGFNGMVNGFHQGILKLAMEPTLLGTALMGGGPDRKIKLDRSPGADELYIEGYLQAMLDAIYKQEYLRVRVIDDQVIIKNLPPNSSLIDEIMDRVKGFLISKALLKGDPSATSRPLRHLQGESEWKIGPTIVTLCEHLFVSFAIRMLRKQASKFIPKIKWKLPAGDAPKAVVPAKAEVEQKLKFSWKWGFAKFVLSGILAYIDGRLCRSIPNPVARRIVSGFILSYIDRNDN
ncbi:hypothetical protein SLA2020_132760 [Shorea laevis]